MPLNSINVINLGRTDYKECWDLQGRLLEQRAVGEIGDHLLLTEHNHVYTIGKTGSAGNLLADDEELKATGVSVYHNDRGGDITYHGPGQLVGYPILDLNNYYLDLHRYLRDIEEAIIRTLATYGVVGMRDQSYTGVWVERNKICAIGVKTSRWITMHGFALNVNTDLSFFSRIIPCGIIGRGVTSLARIVGRSVPMGEVATRIVAEFGTVFGAQMRTLEATENALVEST